MPTYGSQWHLLRYLGYHRDELNRSVRAVIPGSSTPEWLDFPFEQQPGAINADPPRTLDRELEGITFLPDALRLMLQSEWAAFWPQGGNPPNWDAVGRVDVRGCPYWLVVEAKSHIGEMRSTCMAAEHGGRPQIRRAFELTQAANGIAVDAEPWLGPYYQYCNRVSFVHLLNRKGIPAKMLFVYFLGDRFPPIRTSRPRPPSSNGGTRSPWSRSTSAGIRSARSPSTSTSCSCRCAPVRSRASDCRAGGSRRRPGLSHGDSTCHAIDGGAYNRSPMPTKPPDPTTPGPLDGAFYWLPAPTTGSSICWDLIACHDLDVWDGVSHREFWPSVLAHLAPIWGKDSESLKHQLGDHYHGLPRGRVTRPEGKCLILHGRDAPVPNWKARVIDRFRLTGLRVKAPSSDHERVSREDVVALEAALGVDLGLLRA